MKERIREIAGELIKTAALRATRPGVVAEPDSSLPAVRRPLPLRGDRRPGPRDRGRARRPRSGQADGPAGVRRRRLRQDRGRAARRLRHGDVGQAGRADLPDDPARAPALHEFRRAACRASRSRSGACRGWSRRPKRRRPRRASPTAQSTSSSAPTRCSPRASSSSASGLVIVDEEQHFGVAHKERLKALQGRRPRADPDRDADPAHAADGDVGPARPVASSRPRRSTAWRSAPTSRRGTRSWCARRCCASIIAAGRASSSCRASPTCPNIEEWLREQVPEVKAVTAHGQMSATQVEERMSAFYDRKYDVLLSTTIVESGLDIPSANTLIVHRADRFGLAQLYQLRGRVGRSKTRAYAYLTMPADRSITEGAREAAAGAGRPRQPRRRLPARQPRPRHPRRRQSARRRAVGPHQGGRVRALPVDARGRDPRAEGRRRRRGREEFTPQISVDAPILIPETYVPDLDLRMGLYRRLGDLEDRRRSTSSPPS